MWRRIRRIKNKKKMRRKLWDIMRGIRKEVQGEGYGRVEDPIEE